ncbi:unnamed protein product, partial [Effrenium voratum]
CGQADFSCFGIAMQQHVWARYGQQMDGRPRQVAQSQGRPVLLSANYRNPPMAKVMGKQPSAQSRQKATSPRAIQISREATEDRAPLSPTVSTPPSASVRGHYSPQAPPPGDAAAGLGHALRREAVLEGSDRLHRSSPSHLSTSSASAQMGALREKLRQLLPKDLQGAQEAAFSKSEALVSHAGSLPSAEERREQSREALTQKVQDLEARLSQAMASIGQAGSKRPSGRPMTSRAGWALGAW